MKVSYPTLMDGDLSILLTKQGLTTQAVCPEQYLLEHPQEAPMDVEAYLKETARLRTNLERLGTLEVWDTQTHFMLVCMRLGKVSALKDYLANEHGLLTCDDS